MEPSSPNIVIKNITHPLRLAEWKIIIDNRNLFLCLCQIDFNLQKGYFCNLVKNFWFLVLIWRRFSVHQLHER